MPVCNRKGEMSFENTHCTKISSECNMPEMQSLRCSDMPVSIATALCSLPGSSPVLLDKKSHFDVTKLRLTGSKNKKLHLIMKVKIEVRIISVIYVTSDFNFGNIVHLSNWLLNLNYKSLNGLSLMHKVQSKHEIDNYKLSNIKQVTLTDDMSFDNTKNTDPLSDNGSTQLNRHTRPTNISHPRSDRTNLRNASISRPAIQYINSGLDLRRNWTNLLVHLVLWIGAAVVAGCSSPPVGGGNRTSASNGKANKICLRSLLFCLLIAGKWVYRIRLCILKLYCMHIYSYMLGNYAFAFLFHSGKYFFKCDRSTYD